VGIPTGYVTQPTRSTQPCIAPASLNRVPDLIGWGKGGNVTSQWQVTLCDLTWHVSSRSGEAGCKLLYSVYCTVHYGDCVISVVRQLCGSDRSVVSLKLAPDGRGGDALTLIFIGFSRNYAPNTKPRLQTTPPSPTELPPLPGTKPSRARDER